MEEKSSLQGKLFEELKLFGELLPVAASSLSDKSIKWRKIKDWILINTRNWRITDGWTEGKDSWVIRGKGTVWQILLFKNK